MGVVGGGGVSVSVIQNTMSQANDGDDAIIIYNRRSPLGIA